MSAGPSSNLPYVCPFCKKGFATAKAAGSHQPTCKLRKVAHANPHSKRKAGLKELTQAAKRSRTDEDDDGPASDIEMAQDPPPPPPSPPALRSRSGRKIKPPISRWQDVQPSAKTGLPSQIAQAFPPPTPSPPCPVVITPPERTPSPPADNVLWQLPADQFGVFRRYIGKTLPQCDPEESMSALELCAAAELAQEERQDPSQFKSVQWLKQSVDGPVPGNPYVPFNKSSYLLCNWWYNSATTKSLQNLDKLVSALSTPGFSTDNLKSFTAHHEMHHLDTYKKDLGIFSEASGWQETTLHLPAPFPGKSFASEVDAPQFPVKGLQFRHLLKVIISEAQDPRFAAKRHWFPHERYWTPPGASTSSDAPPTHTPPPSPEHIQIVTDTFNSKEMLEAQEEIRSMPRDPQDADNIEYCVVPLLLYSDSTCLANFGSASLWPIYLYIGNISEYLRGKPSAFAAQHIAYIPKLPDYIQDFYKQHYGGAANAETLCWLWCELMQKVWEHLLNDEEFKEAYRHGILVECTDGILHRLFPALLAAMRHLAECPCPCCLIKLKQVAVAGTKIDYQRRAHKRKDDRPLQLTIQRVRQWIFQGKNMGSKAVLKPLKDHSLFPVQSAFSKFLSEVSPGKNFYTLFTPDIMHEFELGMWKGVFNHLLRLLVTQGNGAVQEFNKWWNAHDANIWDYKDFVQTMMPAFEGLLDEEHCEIVTDLLFELANWYALAKLRLHTSVTLSIFRATTDHISPVNRKRALVEKLPAGTRKPKIVEFNISNTYKYHCLADYPDYIKLHGTTVNTTTQLGECEHIVVKIFYDRTNKIEPEKQIATHQQHRGLLHGITEELERKDGGAAALDRPVKHTKGGVSDEDNEDVQPSMYARYVMGQSERHRVNLYNWLDANDGDPACEDFIPRLKNHLIAWKLRMQDEESVLEEYRNSLRICNDVLWEHKIVKLCYTTYDMQRDQDTSNPCTHPDILLLTSQDDDDDFPFAGFCHHRLPRITFNSDPPFGFVDPACILCCAYIIPGWKYGITDQLLPPNSVGRADGLDYDYEAYYTSFFVDRDMYMRFLGGGVGHHGVGVSIETSQVQGARIEWHMRAKSSQGQTEPGRGGWGHHL
ncbi:hypothetical protein C8T65DRAFT_745889 [Cerioporus squamosus]|nr:hypothetical protein C8T65DRAFT_745889 [Cerioporus squamosus]